MIDLNSGSGFRLWRPGAERGDQPAHQRADRRRAGRAQPPAASARLSRRQPHRRALRAQARLRIHQYADRCTGRASTARRCASSTPAISSRRCPFAGCAPRASICATKGRTDGSSASRSPDGRIRGHIDGVIVDGPDVGDHLAGAVRAQGAQREVLDRHRQARRRALEADLLRPAADLHGLHGARHGAVHRAQQGHPGAPSRDRRLRCARPPRRSPTRPSTSSAPRKSASCRRASPPARTSISAAGAPTPSAAGRAGHDLHAIAAAGRRHSRDRGLVSEPASQAAGVPAVRLCRIRKINHHGACHRGARPRAEEPDGGAPAACCSRPSPARPRW